ncbi:hypothetical protein C8J57DRAFT_1262047 [Mycena rebaudengoi]|nr:hypothetical protein C8J57DRAFT_1262047 [Mycena rebaudengoi]
MTSFYTLIGGASAKVVDKLPVKPNTATKFILPIAIKCTSRAEANSALDLHKIFKHYNSTQAEENPELFAKAIAGSTQISDSFATSGPFYAVYDGKTESAIYVRGFSDAETQVQNLHIAKLGRFESIKDALVFMILKGDLERMVHLGLYPKPSNTASSPTYAPHKIGRHAGYYLHAHGYTATTIEEITQLWANCDDVEAFIEVLGSRGMAATEVRWLWDLIRHDDDCGF